MESKVVVVSRYVDDESIAFGILNVVVSNIRAPGLQ